MKEGETPWDVWSSIGEGKNKGWLMRLFTECLESASRRPAYSPSHALGALDWGAIGNGTVVDVSEMVVSVAE